MKNENSSKQHTAGRKSYRKPQLERFGAVNVVTEGGVFAMIDNEPIMYYYSPL